MSEDLDPQAFYHGFAATNMDGTRLPMLELARLLALEGFSGDVALDRAKVGRAVMVYNSYQLPDAYQVITACPSRTTAWHVRHVFRAATQVFGRLCDTPCSMVDEFCEGKKRVISSRWRLPVKGSIVAATGGQIIVPIDGPAAYDRFAHHACGKFFRLTDAVVGAAIAEEIFA